MLRLFCKDVGRWIFWYPFRTIFGYLPLSAVYRLSDWLGGVSFHLMKRRRALMHQELLNIFEGRITPDESARILQRSFANVYKERMEILLFPRLDASLVEKMSSIDGGNNLDLALSKGRGAILLTIHLGNYRFVLPALGLRGYKMNQIGAPPTVWKKLMKKVSHMHARALELELECERSLPAKFVDYDRFIRSAFDRLAANEVLVVAGDSAGGARRIPVGFLNRTAMLSPGPFVLAKRTNAPILPVFVIRCADDTHKVVIGEELGLVSSGNGKCDDAVNLEDFTQLAQSYIRAHPEQYLKHLWWVQTRREDDPVPFFQSSNTTTRTSQKMLEP